MVAARTTELLAKPEQTTAPTFGEQTLMPNIERRGNRWYATLHVPPDVREALGKSKFLQSLKTTDKRVAERYAGLLIPVWKEAIADARGQAPDTFITDALMWRNEYQTNDAALEVRSGKRSSRLPRSATQTDPPSTG